MSDYDDLPEVYQEFDPQGRVAARVSMPTYEALTDCQVVIADNGHIGPTLMYAGSVFSTEVTPCQQWRPLNKAAAKRIEEWLSYQPVDSSAVPQEFINEAAYMLRPKHGEADIPQERWWPAVQALAVQLADKHRGRLRTPLPPGYRPVQTQAPPMPFAVTSMNPAEAGMAPLATKPLPSNAPRQRGSGSRQAPLPMPNANATDAPSQTAG